MKGCVKGWKFFDDTPVMYRLFEGDRLLYVGATSRLSGRLATHRGTWWFPMVTRMRLQVFPTREAAFAAESVAIQEESPVANMRGSGRPDKGKSRDHYTRSDMARLRLHATEPVLSMTNPTEAQVAERAEAEREWAEIQTDARYDALENVL